MKERNREVRKREREERKKLTSLRGPASGASVVCSRDVSRYFSICLHQSSRRASKWATVSGLRAASAGSRRSSSLISLNKKKKRKKKKTPSEFEKLLRLPTRQRLTTCRLQYRPFFPSLFSILAIRRRHRLPSCFALYKEMKPSTGTGESRLFHI